MAMTAQIEGPIANYYVVTICMVVEVESDSFRRCGKVFCDPINQSVFCSCKKFERWGVLCSHGLKVLDTMNIKLLPEKYVLKRWTRETRNCTVHYKNGCIVIDDKLDFSRRNRDLCRKFSDIAADASRSEQISTFLHGVLDQVRKQVDEKTQNIPNTSKTGGNTSPSTDLIEMLTQNPLSLKKRNEKKRNKRHKSWLENLSKKNVSNEQPLKQNASTVLVPSNSQKALDVLGSTSDAAIKIEDTISQDLLMGDPSNIRPLENKGFIQMDKIGNKKVYPSASNIYEGTQ